MISNERIREIVEEETKRFLEEKKKKRGGKSKKDKSSTKQNVSKRDQSNIRSKVTAKDGKNVLNVSALAREAGIDQSLANRYIRGGVHNGTKGWVKYNMPKDAAKKLLGAMAKEKVG